jgi:hypothetical protein
MRTVFFGNTLLPYWEDGKIAYDTTWCTPELDSLQAVVKWLSNHPDQDKTTPFISEYSKDKEGFHGSVRDYYRDGTLVPLETYLDGWGTMWRKTAHYMCAVHPAILKAHDVEDDPEFFQGVMQEGLKDKQPAYCNGCGAIYPELVRYGNQPCECGSKFLTYSEMLEQVNWF